MAGSGIKNGWNDNAKAFHSRPEGSLALLLLYNSLSSILTCMVHDRLVLAVLVETREIVHLMGD